MADEPIHEGLAPEDVRDLVAVLDKLFSAASDDHTRYTAAKQILWDTVAVMMAKGVDDKAALQTVLSACTELLSRAVGPSAAAAHLRLMANKIAAVQRTRP